MTAKNFKDSCGNTTINIIIITAIVFSLSLGIYLYQIFNSERDNLLRQIIREKREKKELNFQLTWLLKSIEPLKNEIQTLKSSLSVPLNSKDVQAVNASRPSYPFDSKKEDVFPAEASNQTLGRNPAKTKYRSINTQNSLTRIKDFLKGIQAENNFLKDKVKGLEGLFAAKEKEISQLSAENINSKKELEQLKTSKSNLESELSEFQVKKRQNENQIGQLNARIKELSSSYEGLKGTVSQLSGLLAKKDADIDEKQSGLYNLKESLERLVKEKEGLLISLEDKEKSISDLKIKMTLMESNIAGLEKELATAKEYRQKAISQIGEAAAINNALRERLLDVSKGLELLTGLEADIDKRKADELRKKVEVKLDLEENSEVNPGQE